VAVRPFDNPDHDRGTGGTTGNRPAGRRLLIAVAVVVLLSAMAVRLLTRREELVDIRRLSTTVLLSTVLFQFVAQLLWNGAMLLPLRTYMKRLGYWELFMVRTGGFVAGYAIPVANLAVRLTYLKGRGLTYPEFAWATALSNVLALSSGAVVAVFALAALWMLAGPPPGGVLLLTAAVLAVGAAGIAVLQFLPRVAGHPRMQRWPWLSSMSSFTTGYRTMGSVLILLLARHGFNFLTFGLLFQSLSRAPVEFLTGGLVYAITSPVRIVAITPGNLGINEWVVAVVGKMLSVDMTTGLIVALVFRGVSVAAQVLGVVAAGAFLALRRDS
jgi:hypothetical protein